VKTLGTEGERLTEIHPNQAEDIRQKQAEIEQNWEKLRKKVEKHCFCKQSFWKKTLFPV